MPNPLQNKLHRHFCPEKRHIFSNVALTVNQIMMMEAGPEKPRPTEFVVGFTWCCDALIITESSFRAKTYDEVCYWQR